MRYCNSLLPVLSRGHKYFRQFCLVQTANRKQPYVFRRRFRKSSILLPFVGKRFSSPSAVSFGVRIDGVIFYLTVFNGQRDDRADIDGR